MDQKLEVICGDAIKIMQSLPKESVDLIVTDPPYNLSKNYGNSKDNLEFTEYLEFSRNWLKEANRLLKKNGTIYIFMGVRYISYIYEILEQEFNYSFNSWITWFYTQGIGKTKGFSFFGRDRRAFRQNPGTGRASAPVLRIFSKRSCFPATSERL